jgi:hypothetical protein
MGQLPTTNLSIMMVRNEIGFPSLDLGTLCSAGEPYINKWAKYKPVRRNFTSNRPADWWKANDGNCGLEVLSYTSLSAMMDAVKNGNDYAYLSPRGGASEPYRLGDFAGYNSEARPPIEGVPMGGTYYKTSDTIPVGCMITIEPPPDGWLSRADIYTDLSNIYFGAAIRAKGATTTNYMTESNPVAFSAILNYPTSGLPVGECEVYRFLCENPKPSVLDGSIANRFIPVPGSYAEFTLATEGVTVSVSGMYHNDGRITGDINVYNKLSSEVVLSQIQVTFRYATSNENDPLQTGEKRISLVNITCAGNSNVSVAITPQYNALPDFAEKNGYVTVTCYISNQGYYTRSIPLMYSIQD